MNLNYYNFYSNSISIIRQLKINTNAYVIYMI